MVFLFSPPAAGDLSTPLLVINFWLISYWSDINDFNKLYNNVHIGYIYHTYISSLSLFIFHSPNKINALQSYACIVYIRY